jgi:ATP-dependent Clp protease, protease subunit
MASPVVAAPGRPNLVPHRQNTASPKYSIARTQRLQYIASPKYGIAKIRVAQIQYPCRSNRPMPLIPYVIEKSGREERAMDIYSRLLKDRIVFLGSQVNDEVANAIVAQMLFLQSDDPKADIHLYINSPGGSVTAGLAIYDTMQFVTCDVATYCIGQCASMGAVLLAAGAAGKRHALPNARIMIHQPLAGMEGTAEEILIHVKEFRKIKEKLNNILLKHTGQSLEKINKDTDRDNFMAAEEALEYRLIDRVIARMERPATPATDTI